MDYFQGCAARNVHSFTQDDIEKMAGEWEEAPSMYLKLDVKVPYFNKLLLVILISILRCNVNSILTGSQSMSHGDNLKETGIEEVINR